MSVAHIFDDVSVALMWQCLCWCNSRRLRRLRLLLRLSAGVNVIFVARNNLNTQSTIPCMFYCMPKHVTVILLRKVKIIITVTLSQ